LRKAEKVNKRAMMYSQSRITVAAPSEPYNSEDRPSLGTR
jgi:hypothetical protein